MDLALATADFLPDPRLPLVVIRYPVDQVVPPHRHEFQEIVYVVRGTARHVIELIGGDQEQAQRSDSTRLMPGDCFQVAPDERHGFVDPDGLVVYNLLFTSELLAGERERLSAVPGLSDFLFLEPLFRRETSTTPKMHLDLAERERVVASLETIAGETGARLPGYEVAARARFIELLVHLARAWTRARDQRPPELAAGQRDAVAQAIGFMEERYGQDLSLRAIAEAAFLSPQHFSELFKKRTGVSPWEYLGRLRIARAKELLRTNDAPVTDVALACGFSDSSYFARVFKAEVGMTPRDWRAQHRR